MAVVNGKGRLQHCRGVLEGRMKHCSPRRSTCNVALFFSLPTIPKNAPCADNSGIGHTTPTAAHKSGIRRLWRRVRTFFCREVLLLQDSQDSSSFVRFASCFARIGTRYENKQEKAEGLHNNPSAGYSGRQRRPQGALYGFCSLKINRQFRGCTNKSLAYLGVADLQEKSGPVMGGM